ncbi:MAG: CoA-binding protein [Desulfovibrionaceae bacterium CG1_02_65_16]|nr:MAG: CoA-binding protein [Desulfovibrionaceae bacterium CG1_02_65_16]
MLHSDTELAALLRQVKTIAILGAKDKPGQPVDRVGRHLIEAGYTVIPVHPKRATVWGLAAYPTLADAPGPIDLVDVFRAADACPAHAREALSLAPRPRCFWMQSGITSLEAQTILQGSGVAVIEDLCLMVEHARLLQGGLA